MSVQDYRQLLEENLRLHRRALLAELRSDGSLESYLQETSEEAQDQYNLLVSASLRRNPPPGDFLKRVSHLSQVYQAADEVVRQNLIQLPDSDTEKAIRQGGYRD